MAMKTRGEFGFIDFIKEHFPVPDNFEGIGDDCAILPPQQEEMLFSTDLLMEGVHFLRNESSPEDVGWKAAAVNLSDIAAMGGEAIATFLSIALPKDAQGEWAERFIEGYAQISKLYGVPLLGGDTTSSLRDIAANVGVMGKCPKGTSIKRSGAAEGDTIFVTGPLGDSAGGLQAILDGEERDQDIKVLIQRHKRPFPRMEEGKQLRESGMVNSMMDISDGIASDLEHILELSGKGATVELERVPVSDELRRAGEKYGWNVPAMAVGGGEDFELLFTAPAEIAEKLGFKVYPIGKITGGKGITWTKEGKEVEWEIKGFKHF